LTPTATPEINQHSPLNRLTPCPAKIIIIIINKELKRNTQQRERGAVRVLEKGGGARS
jgi:hypothetical protein